MALDCTTVERSYIIPSLSFSKSNQLKSLLSSDFKAVVESICSYRKGDLVILDKQQSGEDIMTNGWCFGENARTKERGSVNAECVYILPSKFH